MASPDRAQQSLLNKARKDKFILSFSTPNCLRSIVKRDIRYTHHKSNLSTMPDKMELSVYGAIVPPVNIPAESLGIYGQTMKVSSHTRSAYDDVTVNFTVDNQYNNFWHIWSWLNVLNDVKHSEYDASGIGTSNTISQTLGRNPNSEKGYKADINMPKLLEDYQTDMTLLGLNEFNKEVIRFTYTNAFPVSLGGIDFSYRNSDEIESSFAFSFSQLHAELLD